jgi:hypothetical protein
VSITDKVKWGSQNMAAYLLLVLAAFVIGYLIWLFSQSNAATGEACMNNQDCKSKFCYVEDGRHMRYCTVKCRSSDECPPQWQCLHPPAMPRDMFVCIRP